MPITPRGRELVAHYLDEEGARHDHSARAKSLIGDLIDVMEKMPKGARIMVFAVLGDFFCRRCGIEQPPGDCQCGKTDAR